MQVVKGWVNYCGEFNHSVAFREIERPFAIVLINNNGSRPFTLDTTRHEQPVSNHTVVTGLARDQETTCIVACNEVECRVGSEKCDAHHQ